MAFGGEVLVDRLRIRALAVLCSATLSGGLTVGSVAQLAQAAPARAAHLGAGPAPTSTAFPGSLYGVSADLATDAWAVGGSLILHWNGTNWSKATEPVSTASLEAVTAISPTNVWAVGNYCTSSQCSVQDTLILHWNGTAWTKVPSPNPSTSLNYLYGVSATSATDVWAVGQYFTGTLYDTLILHWDGTAWSKVTSPSPSTGGNFLSAVSATSATDAWAVGDDYASGSTLDTLILHWNGTAWSKVKSPNPSSTFNSLSGVSAISATSAWAVGDYDATTGVPRPTLILHWNGTAWSKVNSPNPSASGNGLTGVTAISGTDAWAVGSYCVSACSTPSAVYDTLTQRWNGTRWSTAKSPSPSSARNALNGVSATSPTDAWAVGSYLKSSNTFTALILHWNGTNWSTS